MRKSLLLFIGFVMALALLTINLKYIIPAHATPMNFVYGVKVTVNDNEVTFPDQKPFIDNQVGRTYVPLRFVSEALGGVVNWNGSTQTASVIKGGTNILMKIGSKNPTVNGQVKVIDASALLMNDRTVVPLRFVSECLGARVEWDAVNRIVKITTASQPPAPDGYKVTSMGYQIPIDTKMEYDDVSGDVNLTLMIIITRGNLETQFKQAEEVLARVHGAKAAKEVVDYARQKTTITPELKDTDFGKLRVYSQWSSPAIYIEVWR